MSKELDKAIIELHFHLQGTPLYKYLEPIKQALQEPELPSDVEERFKTLEGYNLTGRGYNAINQLKAKFTSMQEEIKFYKQGQAYEAKIGDNATENLDKIKEYCNSEIINSETKVRLINDLLRSDEE